MSLLNVCILLNLSNYTKYKINNNKILCIKESVDLWSGVDRNNISQTGPPCCPCVIKSAAVQQCDSQLHNRTTGASCRLQTSDTVSKSMFHSTRSSSFTFLIRTRTQQKSQRHNCHFFQLCSAIYGQQYQRINTSSIAL